MKKKCLQQRIKEGIVDENAKAIFDPLGKKLRGFSFPGNRRKIIDTTSIVYCDQKHQKLYSFEKALELNFIDVTNGTAFVSDTGNHIALQEAFDRNYLTEMNHISIKNAIRRGMYQDSSGLFSILSLVTAYL
ncbi:hypothetical protein CEXT_406751 [Caerostris extrusa]|uniref:Uncharacterized protein n=1 Tax=Caerostris extrusa TaxID=172846 RepID=A0AAV4XYR1_CAEEX|nr:hypothetical protein CEXT_406751 [Caerostris extrusa]